MKNKRFAVLLLSCLVCVVALRSALSAAPDFEALARETVADMSAQAFDKVIARFDEKMTQGLPREKLAMAWGSVVAKFGEYKNITAVRVREVPQQNMSVVELTSTFERMPLMIRLAFNESGKIAGLYFLPVQAPAGGSAPP